MLQTMGQYIYIYIYDTAIVMHKIKANEIRLVLLTKNTTYRQPSGSVYRQNTIVRENKL